MKKKNITVFILLSSGLVALILTQIFVGLIGSYILFLHRFYPVIYMIFLGYHLVIGKQVNYKLITVKVLISVIILKVVGSIVEILSSSLLPYNVAISKLLFSAAIILSSFIPLLLVHYVIYYKKMNISIIEVLSPLLLIVSVSILAILNLNQEIIQITGMATIVRTFPTKANASIELLANLALGAYLIYVIIRGQNKKYRVTIEKYMTIIGMIFYFVIAPFVQYSLYANMNSIYISIDGIQVLGLGFIILPHLISNNMGVNLLSQPIERIIIIQSAGLPVLDHSFGDISKTNGILVSGALTSFTIFIQNLFGYTKNFKGLTFGEIKFVTKVIGELTYVAFVSNSTRVLKSAFDNFSNLFSQSFQEENWYIIRREYLSIPPVPMLFDELFGEPMYKEKEVKQTFNWVMKTIPNPSAYRFAIAGFLTLVSIRLITYQGSTSLLPPDTTILPLLILFGFTISPLLGILYLKFNRPYPHKLIMVVIIGFLFLCTILSNGVLLLLSTWIFSLISWAFFYSSVVYDFQRLNAHERYFSIVFMVLIDVMARYASLGTTLAINKDIISIFLQFLIGVSIIVLAYSERITSKSSKDQQIDYRVLTTFTLANFLLLRFSINIGSVLAYYGSTDIFHYILVSMAFIAFLILFSSTYITKYVLSNFGWIVSLIITVSMIIFSNFGEIPPLIIIFSTICFARLLVELGSNQNSSTNSLRLVSLSFIFSGLIFLLFIITYYGSSNLLLLIPLTLFIYFRIPKSRTLMNVYQVTNNVKMLIRILLISALAFLVLTPVVFNYNQSIVTEKEQFGVMTYNIQYGIDVDGEYNPNDVANYIISSGVSVVGLQEVTRGSLLNGNGDLFLQLARILFVNGFKYSVVMNNPAEIFTNVIFSKYPITSSSQMYFSQNEVYRKGLITATLDVDGVDIIFAVTHLTHIYTVDGNQSRIIQAQETLDFFDYSQKIILVGDMNVELQDVEVALITEVFYDNWGMATDNGYSWPAPNPNQRIDYIFTYGLNATSISIDHQALFSDHYPIIAWFW